MLRMLLKVAALPERMQAAVEAGAKRILIPSENKRDLAEVPDAILAAIQWQFYDSPTKAAILAMGRADVMVTTCAELKGEWFRQGFDRILSEYVTARAQERLNARHPLW